MEWCRKTIHERSGHWGTSIIKYYRPILNVLFFVHFFRILNKYTVIGNLMNDMTLNSNKIIVKLNSTITELYYNNRLKLFECNTVTYCRQEYVRIVLCWLMNRKPQRCSVIASQEIEWPQMIQCILFQTNPTSW